MNHNISEDYLEKVISDVVTECGLIDWKYSKKDFENIAQNYFGVLMPIRLSGKRGSVDVNIELVLKLAPTDERFRVSGAVTLMFAREIFVYSSLLTKYNELQINFSMKFVIPHCYYNCKEYCKEVIAMQNMCEDNYKPFVHSSILDLNHTRVALEALARFHALSFILKENDSKFFNQVESICVPLTENSNKRFLDILLDRILKAKVKFTNTPYMLLWETLRHVYVKLIESMAITVKAVSICHGDIWKENILFKYEDGVPTSACLIDYQTTRISTPAFDLLYLIVSSTDGGLRRANFHPLLDLYYQTFSHTLDQAGMDAEKKYNREMLDHDLQVIGPACLIISNTAIWLSSGLQQEGHVRSKYVWHTDADQLKAEESYRTRMRDIIEDLRTYGYLNINYET